VHYAIQHEFSEWFEAITKRSDDETIDVLSS
jgi:hypothetical protein